jgi:hypothetical protein
MGLPLESQFTSFGSVFRRVSANGAEHYWPPACGQSRAGSKSLSWYSRLPVFMPIGGGEFVLLVLWRTSQTFCRLKFNKEFGDFLKDLKREWLRGWHMGFLAIQQLFVTSILRLLDS